MQDKVMHLLLERDAALASVENKNQNKDVKVKPLSESFIKKKQDELSNNFFYEILQDKITNLLQGRSVQKQRHNTMIHGLADICDTFADLLPLKKIDDSQTISEYTETGFIFCGSKNNPSRIDQLALALLKILRDGIIDDTKHGTTAY